MGTESTAPATFDELVSALQRRLPSLTSSQRRLAERTMSDPEGIAFMTVTDLASAVGVNESTVVRFATGLGLDGYPGLTALCRAHLQDQAQLLRRFSNVEKLSAGAEDPLALAAAFEQANIARTLARVDPQAWSSAVTALAGAPRVHVLGLRKCYTVAYLLGYLLGLVRDGAGTLAAGAGTLADELRRVRPGDCFVGIAIHRYSRDTVRGFRWARKVGATTIALTDNHASPLAAEADHSFHADVTGAAVLRSVTGLVALAQTLASETAAALGTEARSVLSHEEELLQQFDVYESGADAGPARGTDDRGTDDRGTDTGEAGDRSG